MRSPALDLLPFTLTMLHGPRGAAMLSGSRSAALLSGSRSAAMLHGSRSATMHSGSRSAAMLSGSRSATMHSGSRIAPCLRSMFGSPPCCASRCALLADPALPEPGPRMARFTEVSHQRLVGCSSTTARTRTIACTLTTCARNSTAGSSRASQETRRLLSTPPLRSPLR